MDVRHVERMAEVFRNENRRQNSVNHTLYTCSYLVFELICFAALLSISIGISALISFCFESLLGLKLHVFLQIYITLLLLMNFAQAQARHQITYIYPLRERYFGSHKYCCFYCSYPWSIWFGLQSLAYVNLIYQFLRLVCSSSTTAVAALNGDQTLASSTSSFKPESAPPSWTSSLGTTTALFLMSLCSIQYMSVRKLQWDFHMEASRIPPDQEELNCVSFLYAAVFFLFVQTALMILYAMPLMLIILLSRLFHWHLSSTLIILIFIAFLLAHFASFVERQDPFRTINYGRMSQTVSLQLRTSLMGFILIPSLYYWFYKAEVHDGCLTLKTRKYTSNNSTADADTVHLFLLDLSLCILTTLKFSSLSYHALRARARLVHWRNDPRREENRVRPNNNEVNEAAAGEVIPPFVIRSETELMARAMLENVAVIQSMTAKSSPPAFKVRENIPKGRSGHDVAVGGVNPRGIDLEQPRSPVTGQQNSISLESQTAAPIPGSKPVDGNSNVVPVVEESFKKGTSISVPLLEFREENSVSRFTADGERQGEDKDLAQPTTESPPESASECQPGPLKCCSRPKHTVKSNQEVTKSGHSVQVLSDDSAPENGQELLVEAAVAKVLSDQDKEDLVDENMENTSHLEKTSISDPALKEIK